MSRPRKVYVVQTKYFDILFPQESKVTADFLVNHADDLFEKAKQSCGLKNDFRMPVVISPDSDTLSVTYTPSPYNRVVIFDSVPADNQTYYDDGLLGLFYHEVYKAVAGAIRSPFNQFISTIVGEQYAPVSLLNVPFSFIEGRAFWAEGFSDDGDFVDDGGFSLAGVENSGAGDGMSLPCGEFSGAGVEFSHQGGESTLGGENFPQGRFNDGYFLQILSQAKLEKSFPSYFECSVTYENYPGNDLLYAATSAFTAYLIQSYGYKKFEEYWQKSASLHLFFQPGIIYLVYGKSLFSLWEDFKDSVPLPSDLDQMLEKEKSVTAIFSNDQEGLYQQVLYSDYGIIWYDGHRHEVSLFDPNSKSKLRQLLFLADKIDKIKLSPDGQFLVISYKMSKSREEFNQDCCRIYDLREREFLDYDFSLRDAAIILSADGENLLAGVNVDEKYPKIQIFSLADDDDSVLLFEKCFEKNAIPSALCAAGDGKLSYIITKNGKKRLAQWDFGGESAAQGENVHLDGEIIHQGGQSPQGQEIALQGGEIFWTIKSEAGQEINFSSLRLVNHSTSKAKKNTPSDFLYVFEYVTNQPGDFTKLGYITLNQNFQMEKVFLQKNNLYGGANSPYLKGENLYYASKKLNHNDLCCISTENLQFEEGILQKIPPVDYSYSQPIINFSKNDLNGHELSKYYPLKYMFPLNVIPFWPIRKLSLENGASKWPGLGLSLTSHSDPFMNNKFTISAGWTYLPLTFTTAINAPTSFQYQQELEARNFQKDKSFAAFFENTSTPVDIKVGSLFKFNLDGQYNFEAMAGTSWTLPQDLNVGKVTVDLQTYYSASTDYYDAQYFDDYKSLSDWPSFENSYDLFEVDATGTYSNIHQYGISPYEKCGFSAGARFYAFWDLYSYRQIKPEKEVIYSKIGTNVDGQLYSQEAAEKDYNFLLLRVSQMNVGLIGKIEIPRLTPLQMKNGFVLSLPASISAELLNNAGTALKINPEILLLGWEIHDGLSPLLLYFSRIGIKAGYDFKLDYDTRQVKLPDVRRENYFMDIFSQSYINDNIYLLVNVDASSSVGFLSSEILSFELKAAFYPRSQGFVFNFSFVSTF